MKNSNVNGQVLSENQMKEVKGGNWIIVANPTMKWICDVCGEKITEFMHEGENYVAICSNCGSTNEIQIEE